MENLLKRKVWNICLTEPITPVCTAELLTLHHMLGLECCKERRRILDFQGRFLLGSRKEVFYTEHIQHSTIITFSCIFFPLVLFLSPLPRRAPGVVVFPKDPVCSRDRVLRLPV